MGAVARPKWIPFQDCDRRFTLDKAMHMLLSGASMWVQIAAFFFWSSMGLSHLTLTVGCSSLLYGLRL